MRSGRFFNSSGFTYMGMLVIITIIGISASVVGPSWRLFSKAEKEKELLWRGHQFRKAIRQYYEAKSVPSHAAAGVHLYPSSMDDLMKDPRAFATIRYLRKKYTDPVTGKDDWVLVMEGGRIKGVHSNSEAEPLKKDNFDIEDIRFTSKTRYSEWVFDFDPNAIPGGTVFIPTGGNPGGSNP